MADMYTGVITKNGQPFYPQTQANLVKMKDGRTIEAHEEDLRDEISEIKATLVQRFSSTERKTQSELESYASSNSCPNGVSFYPVNYGGTTYALISKVNNGMWTIWMFSSYGNNIHSICLRDGSRTEYGFQGTLS